jgi:aminopeptidase S
MTTARLPALLVLAALVLAGCLGGSAPGTPPGGPGAGAAEAANATAPRVDARETLDMLKAYSEAYPYRQSGQPTHLQARDFLAKAFEDAGLEVVRQRFAGSLLGVAPLPYEGENVIGIKWGEDRAHWVVVGAHYDITEGAVFGAYDDGSGNIMVVKLAEAFANVTTNRTIAFVEFDQEERGLVGSEFFLQSVQDGSFERPVTLDAMVDLDMIGITWPHPAKLVCWQNSEGLKAKAEEARKAVGVPDANVDYREPSGGTSDGATFIRAGVPTIYWWSDWDEVVTKDDQAVPGSYPFWHQADTYESMVAMAGDEATLEAGFQTVLDVVSPVLLYAAGPAFTPDTEAAA